jgi:hypothetical protein
MSPVEFKKSKYRILNYRFVLDKYVNPQTLRHNQRYELLTQTILPHENQNHPSTSVAVFNGKQPDPLVQEIVSADLKFIGVRDARQIQRLI